MGIEVAAPEPVTPAPVDGAASAAVANDAGAARPKPAAKRRDAQRNPIQHVHFSSFIVQ
jgi:hypothetical protein